RGRSPGRAGTRGSSGGMPPPPSRTRRGGSGPPGSRRSAAGSRALPHHFAEETPGKEDQNGDQDREREDVLVLRAEGPARQQREVRGREGLEEPEHEPPPHRAGNVADTAEHRRREGFEPGNEAAVGVDQTVL